MAKGLSSFLDFLFALKKINLQKIFHGMTDDERDKRTPEIITYTWWEINMLMEKSICRKSKGLNILIYHNSHSNYKCIKSFLPLV